MIKIKKILLFELLAFFVLIMSVVPINILNLTIYKNSIFYGYEGCLDKLYICLFIMLIALLIFVVTTAFVIFMHFSDKLFKNSNKIIAVLLFVSILFTVIFCVITEIKYNSYETETFGYSESEKKSYFSFVDDLPSERYDDFHCIRWEDSLFSSKYIRINTELFYNSENYDGAIYEIGYLSSKNRLINNLFLYIHGMGMNNREEFNIDNHNVTVLSSEYRTKYIYSENKGLIIFETNSDNSILDGYNQEELCQECIRLYEQFILESR